MSKKDIVLSVIFGFFGIMILIAFVYLQEGHNIEGLIVTSPSELIVGEWQNKEDTKSVIIYKEDGIMKNTYAGAIVSLGKWSILKAHQPILMVVVDGEEQEYRIIEINYKELKMIYMSGGNILRYIKI